MTSQLPEMLVISDSPLGDEAFGVGRTLTNILRGYEESKISSVTACTDPIQSAGEGSTVFVTRIFPIPPNLIGKLTGGVIESVNSLLIPRRARHYVDSFLGLRPEVCLLSASHPDTLRFGSAVAARFGSPLVTYFMDDLRDSDRTWALGGPRSIVSELLSRSRGLIFISERLKHSLRVKYGDWKALDLCAHNPVETSRFQYSELSPVPHFKLVYAGSLWGMHVDAVVATAQAISLLRDRGFPAELAIYSPVDQHPAACRKLSGVSLNPPVPYAQLPSILDQATLLLVASSFSDRYRHLVDSSLQTKLTDYLAAGRPLISIGPTDCACNEFVSQHGAGMVIETEHPSEIADKIAPFMTNDLRAIGRSNRDLAERAFSTQVVCERFNTFIRRCVEKAE